MAVELLAPAGSFEGLLMNLECGADAVYVGGGQFGARAYARNLTSEELKCAIDEAHIRGKKVYLTVNTLLKNRELAEELYDYLAPLYEQGLDAAIVQDFGVLRFIRREFPNLPIHASTQMTVTGPESAALLEECGAKRVVTARELSLEEIRLIRQNTGLEIESFVHGALCYSYSGQCLFSSLIGGRSGNRGRCAQPCRLPYRAAMGEKRLTGKKESCPLSLKDMNTIDILPEIIEAGVDSLKIEGRMKQAEYAAGVVNIYRKYLDLYLRDPGHYRVEEADRRELLALFSRGGSCTGYYQTRGLPGMLDLANEKKTGTPSGKLTKMKEKVKGILMLSPGERAILEVSWNGRCVRAEGDLVQEAKSRPLTAERISEQMKKTGNTPYEFSQLEIRLGGNVFLPMSALNWLRRDAFSGLMEQTVRSARRSLSLRGMKEMRKALPKTGEPVITASCETIEQARRLAELPGIARIYCGWDFVLTMLEESPACGIGLMLPHVTRPGNMKRLAPVIRDAMERGCTGILARNPESAAWLIRHGYAGECILDAGVYTFNDESIAFWEERGVVQTTAPLELNRQELAGRDNHASEMIVYGRLPMMISAQCVRRNLDGCAKESGILTLTDRYRKEFPVKCCCDFCYNVIYNSLPFGLYGELEEVKRLGFSGLRLSFTIESPGEAAQIAWNLIKCFRGEEYTPPDPLTKGHFKRGVE